MSTIITVIIIITICFVSLTNKVPSKDMLFIHLQMVLKVMTKHKPIDYILLYSFQGYC
jgi:hypothetical protein